jgi:hypothetical protein
MAFDRKEFGMNSGVEHKRKCISGPPIAFQQ